MKNEFCLADPLPGEHAGVEKGGHAAVPRPREEAVVLLQKDKEPGPILQVVYTHVLRDPVSPEPWSGTHFNRSKMLEVPYF
jgi:hypothetical protein